MTTINSPEPLTTLSEEEFKPYLTEIARQVRDSIIPVLVLQRYTVATLPSASDNPDGLVKCTDEVGGQVPCFSDGTDWRRVTDRAIAST